MFTLQLNQRIHLNELIGRIVTLTPLAKRVAAEKIAAEIALLYPPFDGRTRRTSEANDKVRAAFERRRECEVFTIAIPGSNKNVEIVGWLNLQKVFQTSENSLRGRFSAGGGRSFRSAALGVDVSIEVTRVGRFETAPKDATVKSLKDLREKLGLKRY